MKHSGNHPFLLVALGLLAGCSDDSNGSSGDGLAGSSGAAGASIEGDGGATAEGGGAGQAGEESGGGAGAPNAELIDDAGGTVTAEGGVRLVVPEDSISPPAVIEIAVVSPPDDGVTTIISSAWDFSPDGLVFDPAARLTLPFEDPPEGSLAIVWYDEERERWTPLDNCSSTSTRITCDVEHFTLFAVAVTESDDGAGGASGSGGSGGAAGDGGAADGGTSSGEGGRTGAAGSGGTVASAGAAGEADAGASGEAGSGGESEQGGGGGLGEGGTSAQGGTNDEGGSSGEAGLGGSESGGVAGETSAAGSSGEEGGAAGAAGQSAEGGAGGASTGCVLPPCLSSLQVLECVPGTMDSCQFFPALPAVTTAINFCFDNGVKMQLTGLMSEPLSLDFQKPGGDPCYRLEITGATTDTYHYTWFTPEGDSPISATVQAANTDVVVYECDGSEYVVDYSDPACEGETRPSSPSQSCTSLDGTCAF